MKILKDVIYREDKKLSITIILLSVLMLLLSLFDISIGFTGDIPVSIRFGGLSSAILSIFPLSWGVSTIMLTKTKNIFFAKLPSYVICGTIVVLYALYIVITGNKNLVNNILFLSIAVLIAYPFVIAVLTMEGRVYNRVFATVFSSILLVLCVAAFIIISIATKSIMFSLLIPILIYINLLLTVLCFDLKRPEKKEELF